MKGRSITTDGVVAAKTQATPRVTEVIISERVRATRAARPCGICMFSHSPQPLFGERIINRVGRAAAHAYQEVGSIEIAVEGKGRSPERMVGPHYAGVPVRK